MKGKFVLGFVVVIVVVFGLLFFLNNENGDSGDSDISDDSASLLSAELTLLLESSSPPTKYSIESESLSGKYAKLDSSQEFIIENEMLIYYNRTSILSSSPGNPFSYMCSRIYDLENGVDSHHCEVLEIYTEDPVRVAEIRAEIEEKSKEISEIGTPLYSTQIKDLASNLQRAENLTKKGNCYYFRAGGDHERYTACFEGDTLIENSGFWYGFGTDGGYGWKLTAL